MFTNRLAVEDGGILHRNRSHAGASQLSPARKRWEIGTNVSSPGGTTEFFQLRVQIGERCLEHLPMPWIGDSFKLLTHTLARKQKPFMAVFGSSFFGTQRSTASCGGRSLFLLLLH